MRRSTLFLASLVAALGLACSDKIAAPTAAVASANVTGVNAGTFVKLDGTPSSDPQGHPLVYTWSFVTRPLGSNATLIDAQTATPSFFADVPGDYVLQLVVSNNVLTSSQQVKVTVSTCGAAVPVVNSISIGNNSELPAIGATVQFIADVSDADNAANCALNQTLSYQWTLIQQPAGSQARLNSATSQTPSLVTDKAGDYGVRLVVTDSTNRSSAAKDTKVSIPNCGAATPSTTASPVTLTAQPGTVVQLNTTTLDADNGGTCNLNQTFTYAWTVSGRPQGSVALLSDPSAKNPAFTPDVIGDYQFTVVATDNTGRSSQPSRASVAVRCTAAPITWGANAVTAAVTDPQAGTVLTPHVGSAVQLTPHATMADYCGAIATNPLKYQWTLIGAPAGSRAQLDDPNGATPTFSPDVVGTYSVSVVATDQLGQRSSAQTFSISTTTCGDNPLSATISGTAGAINSFQPSGPLTASASTLDNTQCPARFATLPQFTWSIANQPAGGAATLTNLTGPSTQFEGLSAGTYTVRLDATALTQSGRMSAAFALAQFAVSACGSNAPQIVSTSTGVSRAAIGSPVTLTATGFDADAACGAISGATLTYDWTLVSAPAGSSAVGHAQTSAGTFQFTPDLAGTFTYRVVATDDTGHSSAAATITIPTGSCGPSADFSLSGSPALGAPVTASVGATPADNCILSPTLTYAWTLTTRPPDSAAVATGGSSTASFTPDVPGAYVLQLIVSDQGGFSTAVSHGVNVAPCAPPALTLNAPDFTGNPQLTTFPRSSSAVYRDDLVKLSASATSTCAASTGVTLHWTLVAPPAGSVARLSADTGATTSFTVDKPNGAYAASVVAVDSLGNASAPQTVSFQATACGANPIAADFTDTPGAMPFDDHTLTAIPASGKTYFTADDDPLVCPSHFAGQYVFNWSVASSAPVAGYVFHDQVDQTNPGVHTVQFTPGGNAVYDIRLEVVGVVQHVDPAKSISFNCADTTPRPGVLSIASSSPGFPSGWFFRGDTATLSTSASSLCFSPGKEGFAYVWTLQPPNGSTSVLSSAIAANPTFFVDQASHEWTATVIAVDKLGNRSLPGTGKFTSQACGTNSVTASIAGPTRLNGSLPFDPYTFAGSAASDDDNPTLCPARFAQTYAFGWTLGGTPGTLAPLTGPSSTLNPGGNGVYVVSLHAVGLKSGNAGDNQTQVSVQCGDPTPTKVTAPAIASVLPPGGNDGFTRAPGQFFRDDTLKLTASASSVCFSAGNTTFTYGWTISPSNPPALTGANTQTPSFVVNTPGGSYTLTVAAADRLGNVSLAGQSTFTAGTCGASPVSVTTNAVQSSGTKAFDPWTLSATATSADNDPNLCPTRFAQSYSVSWAAQPAVGQFVLSPALGATTTFSAGANGTFKITATGTGSTSGVQGTSHQDITVTCADSTPQFSQTPNIAIASVVPPTPDPLYTTPPTAFFKNDKVTVEAPVSFACFSSAANAGLTYQWTLASGTPTPSLDDRALAMPSFTADAPSKTYTLGVTAQDRWGHQNVATQALTSGICGAAPITATASATQAGGSLPMDRWTLTASPAVGTFFSADADPSKCPSRFVPTYAFAWSSTTTPAGAFSDATTNPTTFTPAAPIAYAIHVDVTGNGQTGKADATVSATCNAPTVATPTITSVNGAAPATTIFVGDAVTVAAAATSNCVSNSAFTYAWSLGGSATTETFTPSASVPTPTFIPNAYGGAYDVSVAVTDVSHQTGTPLAPLTINVSTCGAAAPTVSLVTATQHFDAINRAGSPTPQPLDLTATSTTEAKTTVGTDTFPVPFYLATPVKATVSVNSSLSATCSSFTFVSAQMNGPDGTPIAPEDFTGPAAGTSIANGSTLDFSFTPRVGDVATPALRPGNYTLIMALKSGGSFRQTLSTITAATVHVGGRCGLNPPFADAVLTPASPVAILTKVTADASTSSDADNVPLALTTGAPNFSTGCGLNQTLTYAWALAAPVTSTTVVTPTSLTTAAFTPDIPGDYVLKLTVSDGTTAPTGTAQFTETAH